MKRGVIIGIIVGIVLVLLVVGFFILTNNKNSTNQNGGSQKEVGNSNQMVDCGKMDNPSCFLNQMKGCSPVTVQLTGTDGTPIQLTILGYENETCHFQRKVNNVVNLNCYFPKDVSLTWDLIDQTFGNDKGLQKVVDDYCKPA